ncbi:MAG TPA: bifunctional precorrin-2 dehydrogenase/sirohydrochlorin ferrochelatase [Stellaceae bacterium]
MDYFPVFLDLTGRRCLVIGSGDAAAARAALLVRCGAEVVVVSGRFDAALLDDTALVMVAGVTFAAGETVARAARARGIPVNVMDEPVLCSFIMPAIVDRSPVTIAISTGGASPLLASLLRQWLDHVLPRGLGGLAALAGHCRELVRCRLRDGIERRRFWQEILTGETAWLALDGNIAAAGAALRQALDERAKRADAA